MRMPWANMDRISLKAFACVTSLTQMQALMEMRVSRPLRKVHNDYLAALSREKLSGDALVKEKANVSALNQRMIEHNILKREFRNQPAAL